MSEMLTPAWAPPPMVCSFISTIRPVVPDPAREPEWYVVRFWTSETTPLLRYLNYARLDHCQFTYERTVKNRRLPVTRSWFPGYLFLHIDVARDYWQQIYFMPGIIGVLGSPHPSNIPADDIARLAVDLAAPLERCTAETTIPPGTQVRITKGHLAGHDAVVRRSFKRELEIMAVLFCRPTRVTLDVGDVEVLQ